MGNFRDWNSVVVFYEFIKIQFFLLVLGGGTQSVGTREHVPRHTGGTAGTLYNEQTVQREYATPAVCCILKIQWCAKV